MGLSEAFYERVMANVNLKVMMRIGDNRTAMDMTEWFGKIVSTKKSVGAGVTTGLSSTVFKGALDVTARRQGGESQTVSYSEDEEDLVSAEELKHEMSAEKGLAWFDLGNGKIVKGRAFWFNSVLPETWEGREFLVHPERFENDEIGLADWVDEQILSQEQQETSGKFATKARPSSEPEHGHDRRRSVSNTRPDDPRTATPAVDPSSPFKVTTAMGRDGIAKPRGTIMSFPKTTMPAPPSVNPSPPSVESSSPRPPPVASAPAEQVRAPGAPTKAFRINTPLPGQVAKETAPEVSKEDGVASSSKGPKAGPLRLRRK
jgi:hypothetical protein